MIVFVQTLTLSGNPEHDPTRRPPRRGLTPMSTTSTAGTHLAREIATQPDDWEAVARRLPEVAHLLPARGERVAVIGCGTSLFMARCYAELRERAGHGVTDAWPASEHRLDRGYDRVVAITRSGTTTEVIEVLRGLQGGPTPTTVITADGSTPVADLADPLGPQRGRRAVRRPDPVRHHHAGTAPRRPGARPGPRRRPGPRGAGRRRGLTRARPAPPSRSPSSAAAGPSASPRRRA